MNTEQQVLSYIQKGDKALKAGKAELAVSFYTEGLALNHDNISLLCGRAAAYLELQKYEEAFADATTATSTDPDNGLGWYRLGQAHSRLGEIAEAAGSFSNASLLEPNNEEFKTALHEHTKALDIVIGDQQDNNDTASIMLSELKLGMVFLNSTIKNKLTSVSMLCSYLLKQTPAKLQQLCRQSLLEQTSVLKDGSISPEFKQYFLNWVTTKIHEVVKTIDLLVSVSNLEQQEWSFKHIFHNYKRFPEFEPLVDRVIAFFEEIAPLHEHFPTQHLVLNTMKCMAFFGAIAEEARVASNKQKEKKQKRVKPGLKSQHCKRCAVLNDDRMISVQHTEEAIQTLLSEIECKPLLEKEMALKRLSLDSQACLMLLESHYSNEIIASLNNYPFIGYLLIANIFGHEVEDNRFSTPSEAVKKLISAVVESVLTNPSNLVPASRALANIAYSAGITYSSALAGLVPLLNQKLLTYAADASFMRLVACFSRVPALAQRMKEERFNETIAFVLLKKGPKSRPAFNFLISALHYLEVKTKFIPSAPLDKQLLEKLNVEGALNMPTIPVCPQLKKLKSQSPEEILKMITEKPFLRACNRFGDFDIITFKQTPAGGCFIVIALNSVQSVCQGTVYLQDRPNTRKHVEMLALRAFQADSESNDTAAPLVPISWQQAADITRIVIRENREQQTSSTMLAAAALGVDKATTKCKTLHEFFSQYLPERKQSKTFAWWREFLRSDFYGTHLLTKGDLRNMGAAHAVIGSFMPVDKRGKLPTPIPSPTKEWIINTSTTGNKSTNVITALIRLNIHQCFFFTRYGTPEALEIAKDISFNINLLQSILKPSTSKKAHTSVSLMDSPLALAYIERANYLTRFDVSLANYISEYNKIGLQGTISKMLSDGFTGLQTLQIPPNADIDQFVSSIIALSQQLKMKSNSFFDKESFADAYSTLLDQFSKQHPERKYAHSLYMLGAFIHDEISLLLETAWRGPPQQKLNIEQLLQTPETRTESQSESTTISDQVKHQFFKNTCIYCSSDAKDRCSRCKKVYYCSKQCQKEHWKEHKKECVQTK